MKYYQIALPLNVKEKFVYKSETNLNKGCRVLVSIGNMMQTGIVWNEVEKKNNLGKYKNVLEIIDKKPVLGIELQNLAEWISKYYECSLGSALFSMLPKGINIQLQQKVIRRKSYNEKNLEKINDAAKKILANLNFEEEKKISEIKNKVKITNFYYWLEYLENLRLIEIKRQYDFKIKKKIANFIILNDIEPKTKLTKRQKEAVEEIINIGKEFPLAKIAKKYSYSIIRALEEKKILKIEARELLLKEIEFKNISHKKNVILTDEQQAAIASVKQKIDENIFQPFLLFGITGSGKTEVYIEIIKHVLNKDKTALLLVPEIALTPQMMQKFFEVFGEGIAILHSHLNEREKWKQWKKIKSGKCKIVIGARSAIFAPLQRIGVIIVDEEHENSYKQDKTPRYNGRDLAIVRAKMNQAVVVLGSATPSLESWENVTQKKYQLLNLENWPLDY